jgi:glutathione S-transferase
MDTTLLWHIPLSHYSEKVRWALDYKGIAHRRRVLGPDYLIRVWRATGQGKLPVLWLDGRAIVRFHAHHRGTRRASPRAAALPA